MFFFFLSYATKSADTGAGTGVDAAGERSSAHVVPVRIVGRELLGVSGLGKVHVFGQLNLAGTLQILGKLGHKDLALHVLHAKDVHCFARRHV